MSPFAGVPIRQSESLANLAVADDLVRDFRELHPQILELRRKYLLEHFSELQRVAVLQSGRELLSDLGEAGMAWRDVARIAGVSVAAVQKWRRGDGITGANRLKLAEIVAILRFLEENCVNDVVSWLEVPLRTGVSLTAMDLLAAGRFDLVLELGHDENQVAEVATAVLDEFDPNWPSTRMDGHFEVFTASDGVRSIRPKG